MSTPDKSTGARPSPWVATPPYTGCDGTKVPWTVHDEDGELVCVLEGYETAEQAHFAAKTIVHAARVLERAIDYVEEVGDCLFCTLNGDGHEPECPLAEVE